jgi:protein PhnA
MFDETPTLDAFGNALASGDTVQLTQPLKVKGTKVSLDKGTKVKNIRLTDDPEEIEANIPEVKGLVLKTCFVKKVL